MLRKNKSVDVSITKQIEIAEKKYKRKCVAKKVALYLFITIITIGSFKAYMLDSSDSKVSIEENAFVETYISNYYSYPMSEENLEYIDNFSINISKIEWDKGIKDIYVSSVNTYKVNYLDNINEYYLRVIYTAKSDKGTLNYTVYNKINVMSNDNDYLVIGQIENLKTDINPIDKDELEISSNVESGSNELSEVELKTSTDLIEMFLDVYSNNYDQALLLTTIEDLNYLDSTTSIELISIDKSSRDEDFIYIVASMNVKSNISNRKVNYFIKINNENKIEKMEVI